MFFLTAIFALFGFGFFSGKKSQKIKELTDNINDAIKSKKRQNNRRNDLISTIKRRMQQYIRK